MPRRAFQTLYILMILAVPAGVLRRELDLGVGRGAAAFELTSPRTWRLGVRLGWR